MYSFFYIPIQSNETLFKCYTDTQDHKHFSTFPYPVRLKVLFSGYTQECDHTHNIGIFDWHAFNKGDERHVSCLNENLNICFLTHKRLPHECAAVLQWIPAHCGIPGNDLADRLAKSGSKKLQPPSTSTYQEAKDPAPKQTEDRVEESRWGLQTQPTIPSTSSRDATRPQSWGCEQTTVDYEPTWSALVSLTLLTATARQHNKQFTIWSRNVPCVTCREDRLGHRSCGEQRKICVAPSTSWQHLISESDTGDRMQKKKKTSNKTVKTHPPRVVHPKCQLSDWHESSCSHMP